MEGGGRETVGYHHLQVSPGGAAGEQISASVGIERSAKFGTEQEFFLGLGERGDLEEVPFIDELEAEIGAQIEFGGDSILGGGMIATELEVG
jgi:hypothetical protein